MALRLCSRLRNINRFQIINVSQISRSMASEGWGSGAGKGGGGGGSIREAGGSFGQMEAAREEEYFRRKQKEQLESMRKGLDNQKDKLEDMIKEHEKEIKRLQDLQNKENK